VIGEPSTLSGTAVFASSLSFSSRALEDRPVVVVSTDAIPQAYVEFAERRRRGEIFLAMLMVDDPRTAITYDVAAELYRSTAGDEDRRVQAFTALESGNVGLANGLKLADVALNDSTKTLLREMLMLTDGAVVRSDAERARLAAATGVQPVNVATWFAPLDVGTWERRRSKAHIVIWAPQLRAEQTAVHVYALGVFHVPIIVVCVDGAALTGVARSLRRDDPELADVLAEAVVIVDASPFEPGWAFAFAERGATLVVTSTSGAAEHLIGAHVYIPWSVSSLRTATEGAIGDRPTGVCPRPALLTIDDVLERARPARTRSLPLVSIVIPTYNRPRDAERAVRLCCEQDYANLEIIVVNDGGSPVAPLERIDPRVRVFDREMNGGVSRALNFGAAQARGTYIQLLADDDALYRDHLARLVFAAEQSGAAAARGNCLIRYENPAPSGGYETVGYNASTFTQPMDWLLIAMTTPVAGQAMLIRREVWERLGGFDPDLALSDQDFQIRLLADHDMVHVDRVTCEWLIRTGEHNFSTKKDRDPVADCVQLFAKNPRPGLAYVERARQAMLENVGRRPPGFVFPPTAQLKPWNG
jgi:hypothetical protein